jgi:hypothetical protein
MSKKNTSANDPSYLTYDLSVIGTKKLATNYAEVTLIAQKSGFMTCSCSFAVANAEAAQCAFRMVLFAADGSMTVVPSTVVMGFLADSNVSGTMAFQVKTGGKYGLDVISETEQVIASGSAVFTVL